MPNNLELDNLDKALLSLVQLNNRTSSEALGTKVGLSTAAVQRRLRRLRDAKVIRSDVAVVDRSQVGYSVQLLVHVELERESKHSIDQFRQIVSEHKCIQHVFYVTGQYDFILTVVARDIEHYESISEQLFLGSDEVKSFTTSVVMGVSKQTCFVPLD